MSRGRGILGLLIAVAAVGAAAFAGGSAPTTARPPAFDSFTLAGKAPRAVAAPQKASVTWCGTDESPANRTPDVELSSRNQVHVVYAIPSDGADSFSAYSSRIASDAEAIDGWWRGQDPTRTPRFDLFAFPNCASRFGMLDISVIRLPQNSAYYGGSLDVSFERLSIDLEGVLNQPQMKSVVYYDGPVAEPRICGVATISADTGGLLGKAFIFLRSACPSDLGQGGYMATAAVHELTHNLGAMSRPGAPNSCPGDPGHVCDSTNDLLYPFLSVSSQLPNEILDFGRNDYYGHSNPSLYDVQDATFLVHLPQYPVSVAVSSRGGPATGTVTMTQPATGFSCTASCTATLDNGIQSGLAARAGANSRLIGWEGACSGTGACNVMMDGPKSVNAVFGPATFAVSVSIAGKGRVTSTPAGISCTSRCSKRFPAGGSVHLKAKAAKGFRFTGWSGACHGTGACTLAVDRDRAAKATFKKRKRS